LAFFGAITSVVALFVDGGIAISSNLIMQKECCMDIIEYIKEIRDRNLNASKEMQRATLGLALAIMPFNFFGVYRFYKKDYAMGALYIFTAGLFFIGWIRDIVEATKEYREVQAIASALEKLGVDIAGRESMYSAFLDFHEEKLGVVKKKYGVKSLNSSGAVFRENSIVVFPYSPHSYYFLADSFYSTLKENKDVNVFLDNIRTLEDIEKRVVEVNFDEIERFEVRGNVHYDIEISGGGSNILGALGGAVLFGSAGAIGMGVNSIESSTAKKDDRCIVITSKKSGEIVVSNGNEVDTELLVLRKKIPQKEYSFEKGWLNDCEKQEPIPESVKQISVDEFQTLKRLFEEGIITQEEFDAKKKQLLGL